MLAFPKLTVNLYLVICREAGNSIANVIETQNSDKKLKENEMFPPYLILLSCILISAVGQFKFKRKFLVSQSVFLNLQDYV